jgi:hypothetical protein
MALRAKGCDITDDCYVEKAFDCLPDAYSNSIAVAKVSQVTKKADINNLLLASRIKRETTQAPEANAMYTERKKQGKAKKGNNKKKKCSHCKKSGHIAKDCWIMHPELKPDKDNGNPSRGQSSANMAKATRGQGNPEYLDDGDTLYGMMTVSGKEENDDLNLDSGANVCITNDRSLLTNYVQLRRTQEIIGCTGHDMKAEG